MQGKQTEPHFKDLQVLGTEGLLSTEGPQSTEGRSSTEVSLSTEGLNFNQVMKDHFFMLFQSLRANP